MNLMGSLEATTLGDLFGALHRERASGALELVEGPGATAGRCHQVEFRDGRVVGVRSPLGAPPLGELLCAAQLIDGRCHQRILAERQENPRLTTGHFAVTLGSVPPVEVTRVLRLQRAARLEALFGLTHATIRFRVPRPAPIGCGLEPMSPLRFLIGRRRARERVAAEGESVAAEARGERDRALATLGLPSGASRDEVRRAFRRLAARLHPDVRRAGSAEARSRSVAEFAQLSAAYHRLAG